MNITAKFYLYFVCVIFLSLLVAFGWVLHMSLSIVGAVLFVGLFLVIKRDFVDPLRSVWSWLGNYKDYEDYQGDLPKDKASFAQVSSAIDHLAKENQSLYDDMEAVLNHQLTRLSKKTAFLEILYSMSERINKINSKEALFNEFLLTLIKMSGASGGIAREVVTEAGHMHFRISAEYNTSVADKYIGVDAPCLHANGVQFSVYDCPSCTKNTAHIGTIFIPLIYKETKLGAFGLFFDSEPSLAYDERMLLQTIGDNVAVYLDKLNQIEHTKQSEIFKQRLRLSQDIHDSLAQTIYSMNISLSMLKESIATTSITQNENDAQALTSHVEKLEQHVIKANSEIRTMIESFRTPASTPSELRTIIDKFTSETSIKLYTQIEELEDKEKNTQLTMIISEALANIKKHSKAHNARVMLGGGQLLIEDDGVGFDISNTISDDNTYHLGTKVMKERAERIGAKFYIESDADSGTIIVVNYEL